MRDVVRLILAILMILLTPSAVVGQHVEVLEAIGEGNTAFIEAMSNADARALAAIYDVDGARLGGGGEVVRGRSAITDQIGALFTRVGPITVTLETADVWVVDDLAYETGEWVYTFTPSGGARRTIGGRYVTVWKHQEDESWKIFVDMSVPGTEN